MIPVTIRNKIVQDTDIVEVVNEYVPLIKKGNNMVGICPFHDDKNPSMSVSNKVKMFNCFSCGTKGNVIYFLSRFKNISIDDATMILAKRLGMEINTAQTKEQILTQRLQKVMSDAEEYYKFYLNNSTDATPALDYLNKRFITKDIITEFNIGLAPDLHDGLCKYLLKKGHAELDLIELGLASESNGTLHDTFRNRIMFPLKNQYGKTVGFSGRIYTKSDQAKYINSTENKLFHKGNILYNFDKAQNNAKKLDQIYLFEGFMDVIAATRSNVLNGVATMGTALTRNHINSILNVTKNIVLCFDGDEAGIKAMMHSTELLGTYNIIPQAVVLPDNLDPDEYSIKYGFPALKDYLTKYAKPVYQWLYHLAKKNFIKGDLISLERFKHKVFDYIMLSNEATVIDFFLNKLSIDTEVSIDILKQDFDTYSRTHKVRNNNYDLPDNEVKTFSKPKELSSVRVTKGIKQAYEIVILYALSNPGMITKYFRETDEYFPGKELQTEYSILLEIRALEQVNAISVIDHLKKNQTFLNYLNNTLTGKFITNLSLDDYEQSIKTINLYLDKLQTRIQKNRLLAGDISAMKDFEEQKKKERKNG